MNSVKLEDVLEAIELANEEGNYYYNKVTGEIIYLGNEESRIAEDITSEELEDYPEWQREDIEAAIDVFENFENYITMPSKYEIDEYNIMCDFCYSLENDRTSNQLLNALNGRGAFRRFKDTAASLNLEDKWYKYQEEAYRNIALEWCETNGIGVEKINIIKGVE